MYSINSQEAHSLIANVNAQGINYIAQNFKLIGITVESDNSVSYNFEFGINITHTGYSASSQDVLETVISNENKEILMTY